MSEAFDWEAEYNNRARVPDYQTIIDGWARSAGDYRTVARCELNLAYGSHARNTVDLFHPKQDRNGPIALFIHGGYWRAFDKSSYSHMARGLNAHGIPVAVPSYRLCPEVEISDIINDMRLCANWLVERAGRPLFCVGHSAGGHLAAALLADAGVVTATAGRHGHRIVPGAAPISGLFDLSPMLNIELNETLQLDPQSAQQSSPIGWHPPSEGTLLHAYVGAEESNEFKRQSRQIVDAWGEVGVHAVYEEVAGCNHFTVINGLAEPDSSMTVNIAHLIHSLE